MSNFDHFVGTRAVSGQQAFDMEALSTYLDRHLDEFMPVDGIDRPLLLAAVAATLLEQEADARTASLASTDPHSPWATADGWRLGHAGGRPLVFLYRDEQIHVRAQGASGQYTVEYDGRTHAIVGARLLAGVLSLRLDAQARRFVIRTRAGGVTAHDGQRRLHLTPVSVYRPLGTSSAGEDGRIVAPMPGRVVIVKSSPGQAVKAGQELLVIEAMKMELAIKSPRDGVVAAVHATAGDFVDADTVLATLEVE